MNKYESAYEFIELCVRPWEHKSQELDRPVMNTQKQDNMDILKELVEKEIAEKPFYDALETDDGDEIEVRVCPNCCETLSFINNFPYCPFCGKKLNWEE